LLHSLKLFLKPANKFNQRILILYEPRRVADEIRSRTQVFGCR